MHSIQQAITNNKSRVILAATGLIALFLRLFNLDSQSFWHDEILSLMLAESSWSQVFSDSYLVTNVSPFFYLLIKPLVNFHNPEFVTRLPSTLFALLSFYFFNKIAQKLTSESTAFTGTLLFSFSAFHIWYSQEMRPYNMLIFLSLLAVYLLLKILFNGRKKNRLIGFIITTAAIFYCHTLGIAFIGFLFFAALIYSPRDEWLQWCAVFGVVALLLIPGLWEILSLPKFRSADSYRSFQIMSLPYSFWVFLAGYSLGPSVSELHTSAGLMHLKSSLYFIVPIGLLFGSLTLYALNSLRKTRFKHFLLLTAWAMIPGSFAFLGSIFSNQPFNTRYILLAFPAVILLWATGISLIPHSTWRFVLLALFITVNGFSLNNHYFNPRYAKEDNRGAGTFFLQHASKDDLAVCSAFYAKKGLAYYARHPEKNLIGYRPDKHESREEVIFADLQKIIGRRQSFWLYLSRNFNAKQVAEIRKYCDTHFIRAIDKHFSGVELTYYKKPKLITKNLRIE